MRLTKLEADFARVQRQEHAVASNAAQPKPKPSAADVEAWDVAIALVKRAPDSKETRDVAIEIAEHMLRAISGAASTGSVIRPLELCDGTTAAVLVPTFR